MGLLVISFNKYLLSIYYMSDGAIGIRYIVATATDNVLSLLVFLRALLGELKSHDGKSSLKWSELTCSLRKWREGGMTRGTAATRPRTQASLPSLPPAGPLT